MRVELFDRNGAPAIPRIGLLRGVTMSLRILRCAVHALLLLVLPCLARADVVDLHGEFLTIKSKNVSVSFKGAEVVRIANEITGELYFNNVVKLPSLMEMPMVTG